MPLFTGPAVKELKKQANFIGGLFGQAHLGQLSPADRDDVVGNESFRSKLQAAWTAAAAEAGEAKATKAAVSAAKIGAESYARLGQTNYGDVMPAAERAVRDMLSAER